MNIYPAAAPFHYVAYIIANTAAAADAAVYGCV